MSEKDDLVEFQLKVLDVKSGDIFFEITCGEKSLVINIDEYCDAIPDLMAWLEAIVVGVQECSVFIEQPGSGVRLYYKRHYNEEECYLKVLKLDSMNEDVIFSSLVNIRQMINNFYMKLFYDMVNSKKYKKEEWEVESVGEFILKNFDDINTGEELLDKLMTFDRVQLEKLFENLIFECYERTRHAENVIFTKSDKKKLKLDELRKAAIRESEKCLKDVWNYEFKNKWEFPVQIDAVPQKTKRNWLIWMLGHRSRLWGGCNLRYIRSEIIEKYLLRNQKPKPSIHVDKCYFCKRYARAGFCRLPL